jgi:hypothetical protein
MPVAVCDVHGAVLLAEALRLRHRSRYQVSLCRRAPGGTERYGEPTADPVSGTVDEAPALLVMLRVLGEHGPRPEAPPVRVTRVEAPPKIIGSPTPRLPTLGPNLVPLG